MEYLPYQLVQDLYRISSINSINFWKWQWLHKGNQSVRTWFDFYIDFANLRKKFQEIHHRCSALRDYRQACQAALPKAQMCLEMWPWWSGFELQKNGRHHTSKVSGIGFTTKWLLCEENIKYPLRSWILGTLYKKYYLTTIPWDENDFRIFGVSVSILVWAGTMGKLHWTWISNETTLRNHFQNQCIGPFSMVSILLDLNFFILLKSLPIFGKLWLVKFNHSHRAIETSEWKKTYIHTYIPLIIYI